MCSPCSGRLGGCLAVTDAGCAIDVDSGTVIDVVAAVDEYRIPAVLQTELPMQIRSHGIFMVVMNTNWMFQLRRKGIQYLLPSYLTQPSIDNFDIWKTQIVLASFHLGGCAFNLV